MIADIVGGVIRVGWSKCHEHLDTFNKHMGKQIAIGRAETGTKTTIPYCLRIPLLKIFDRAISYHKDCPIDQDQYDRIRNAIYPERTWEIYVP